MRQLRKIGLAFAVLLSLSVAATSSAAADPLFLFTKTGFVGSGEGGGAATLSTLGNFFSIACKQTAGSGNIGGSATSTFKGVITFYECNATALGAASGEIWFEFDGLLCWINEAKLEVGAYLLLAHAVHVELPLIGLLSFAAGSSDVAAITPVGTKTKNATLKLQTSGTGDQKVTSCTTSSTTLKPKIEVTQNEGGGAKDAAILTEGTVSMEEEGVLDG